MRLLLASSSSVAAKKHSRHLLLRSKNCIINSAHCRRLRLSPSSISSSSSSSSVTFSTSSSSSSWKWDESSTASSAKGLLLNLLTNQQRTLLNEQKQISQSALELAHKINHGAISGSTGGIGSNNPYFPISFLEHLLNNDDNNDNTHIDKNESIESDAINSNDENKQQQQRQQVESKHILDSTFSIVVAGEFNSGKSTLINALLGQKLLETGALPTTDTVTVLTSLSSSSSSLSETITRKNNNESLQDSNSNNSNSNQKQNITTTTTHHDHSNAITLHRIPNIPLLQDLTFIDTPGTNAIITNHTERTLKLLPSADLILFVTSADRPFPESERKLLQSIQGYRKNIVIVINKMDVLESSGGNHGDREKKRVYDFVADNAADLLGARAVILTVSARDALSAKLIHGGGSSGGRSSSSSISNRSTTSNYSTNNNYNEERMESSKLWKRSEFAKLESFLKDSLTEEAKIQAKLLNPLGVTDGLLSECSSILEERRKELETDVATVNLLSNQMNAWKGDMDKDIIQFQLDVKDHMQREMDRCSTLIDSIGFLEKYSLFLFDDGSMLQSKWDRTKSIIVSNNIEKEIIETVRESTDAIATSARAQGQAVIEYLGKRPAVVGQNLIGSVTAASRFEETRKDLYNKMIHAVNSVLSNYDAEQEKGDVFQSLKNTVYMASALNMLSLASGVGVALDVVNILPGCTGVISFAGLGVGIELYRTRQTKQKFEAQWEHRIEKLNTAFDTLCSKEVSRIHKKILDGVAPYSRYVTTEREDVDRYTMEIQNLLASSQSLRNRIVKLR